MNPQNMNTNLGVAFTCIAVVMLFCLTTQSATADNTESRQNTTNQPTRNYRDPFWPVGFKPPDTDEAGTSAEEEAIIDQTLRIEELWKEALSKISIKSVSKVRGKDGKDSYAAMINNTMVKEGQILRIRVQDTIFRIRVRSIDMENGVKLERIKD